MIPSREALALQLATFAGAEPESSFLEVRCLRKDGPGPRRFMPVRELTRIAAEAGRHHDVDVYVGAAPRIRKAGTARDVERVWSLWADCDSEDAVKKLRKFRPLPSIVIRTSPGRLQALWSLREPLAPEWARRANRRLAYHLGADMAATDPARILRACGTFNHKHSPPAPVTAARVELDVFRASEVVGVLCDVPQPQRSYVGEGRGSADALARTVREAPIGERNAVLFWAACKAHEGRHDPETIRNAGLACGLAEFEVDRTLESAARTVL